MEKEYIAYSECPTNTYYVVYKSTHRANSKANLLDAQKQYKEEHKVSINFTSSKIFK